MIDQRVAREKLENLMRDKDGQLYELALRLDLLDAAIHDEKLIQHQATRERLERISPDLASKFRPPPRPGRAEQRSTHHVGANDDIEELVIAAQGESELDRLTREHLVDKEPAEAAPLLRRYFSTTFTVR